MKSKPKLKHKSILYQCNFYKSTLLLKTLNLLLVDIFLFLYKKCLGKEFEIKGHQL